MRISDWSSDVCSSDLEGSSATDSEDPHQYNKAVDCHHHSLQREPLHERLLRPLPQPKFQFHRLQRLHWSKSHPAPAPDRSEEHTSELQSLMRTSYAVFCLKKTNTKITHKDQNTTNTTTSHHTYHAHNMID